jgi:glucans biosynthesis protein
MLRTLALLLAVLLALPASAFDFDDVAAKAKALAADQWEKPDAKLPRELVELGYDQYRDIRYKKDHALWHGAKVPFEIQFFHPGLFYGRPLGINTIDAGGMRPLKFEVANFDYGHNTLDLDQLKGLGYGGVRIHYPLNTKAYLDELAVFAGASYFRALGKGQRYGLSARGLAVDTGSISGEEFPVFTDFWLVKPRNAKEPVMTLYALLDSRRVTGAYQFDIKPGDTTSMEVHARVFLRDGVDKLGIAPLSSMFYCGENQPPRREDYRPEVHDSDGLQIRTDTEWLWRPLVNPRRLLITSFGAQNPRGFGLMQRDRSFQHFEDLEARYELRPSAWIEPKGDWGAGRVELVQIPTPDETNDNIVAYWVPAEVPPPGQPLDLSYTLNWEMSAETRPTLAHVAQVRRGIGYHRSKQADDLEFHVDFEGGDLATLKDDAQVYAGVWVGDNGELVERNAYRNEVTGGWRVDLRLRREERDRPVEMRVILRHEEEIISETLSYILPGEPE